MEWEQIIVVTSHKHYTIWKSLEDIRYALLISVIEDLILDNYYTLLRTTNFSKHAFRTNETQ